jgi:arylformamidase
MIAELPWHDCRLHIDFSAGQSLAITLDPHGPQPSFFAGERARSKPLRIGDYVGDVSQGGSCNAEVLEFIPHCHGTHTECRAHLDHSAGKVLEIIDQQPGLARLISLKGRQSGNGKGNTLELEDILAIPGIASGPRLDALIIRSLPNQEEKKSRDYSIDPDYPVLSDEAMDWLSGKELKHLLIDAPSLDRAHDGGKLANHRKWWTPRDQLQMGEFDPQSRSVTEMIYVPDHIEDGYFWLHLELQPLAADATASRPVIYPVEIISE